MISLNPRIYKNKKDEVSVATCVNYDVNSISSLSEPVC